LTDIVHLYKHYIGEHMKIATPNGMIKYIFIRQSSNELLKEGGT